MQFPRFKGGPRADFASLTGASLNGVSLKLGHQPGPRKESIPDKTDKLKMRDLHKPPAVVHVMPDPFHGDIGVQVGPTGLDLSKLMEPYKKALKRILRESEAVTDGNVAVLVRDTIKNISANNILLVEIFRPIITIQREEPYSRMSRMVRRALGRLNAMDMEDLVIIEFPFDQK